MEFVRVDSVTKLGFSSIGAVKWTQRDEKRRWSSIGVGFSLWIGRKCKASPLF